MRLKILLLAGAAVLVLSILFLINRFIFSWGGLLFSTVNLCEYKSIGVPTENAANKTLAQFYQLHEIAAVMKAKGNYDINERASGGQGLVISRIFNGVNYNIIFDTHKNVSEFNLNTYNFRGYPSGTVTGGEKCTTASYSIEKKVYQMIDDMPLNSAQRTELKENVRVINATNIRITF